MNKRIFNKKWLYLFSIFLFIYLMLFSVILLFGYYPDFHYFHLIVNTSLFILSVFTIVLLFEKSKKCFLTINLFFGVFILLTIFKLLFTVKPEGYFLRNQILYLLFSIVYLIFVNKFKIKKINYESIDRIGQKEE
jgi:hypothetical protein